MTSTRLTDTELPLAADVIDAIHAAATDDTETSARIVERLVESLTPEQISYVLALAVGMAGGTARVLADMTRSTPDEWIRYVRQRAAA
ncbi:hypothetical protein ACGFIY_21190 [Micromonospora chersina]|uniref:hypothetical protein n=1 Tax=Micromonospora chersina TaxID=47854 RepID=UPI003723A157